MVVQNIQKINVKNYIKCSLFLKKVKELSEGEPVLENKNNDDYTKSQNEGGQEI